MLRACLNISVHTISIPSTVVRRQPLLPDQYQITVLSVAAQISSLTCLGREIEAPGRAPEASADHSIFPWKAPRVNIPLAKENLHLVILENQDSAAISLCIQLLIETMIRSFFLKVNIFWKVRCEKGGDLCGRGDVRCEGREEGGSCCRGRGYSPQRREGREEEPFMVTGGEVLTAKCAKARRKGGSLPRLW